MLRPITSSLLSVLLLAAPLAPALAQDAGTEAQVPGEESLDELPALDGPLAVTDMLGLPVRTYGGAPPVAVVDDLLLKADGTVDKMVLDDGTFLRLGLDGKRVALPYAAASVVPGGDGGPAYLRINIAKAYGQVIKEFLYDLISPSDYAAKAILGGAVAATGAPGAGRVIEMTMTPAGRVTEVALDISTGAGTPAWIVSLPFSDLRLSRPSPKDETRLSTPLTLDRLRVMGASSGGGISVAPMESTGGPPPSPPVQAVAPQPKLVWPTPPETPAVAPSVVTPAPITQPMARPLPAPSASPGWTPGPGVILPEDKTVDVPPMR
jgi:hypothetical protein